MKYYIFYDEKSDFSELLNDHNLKKLLRLKIMWKQHLMLGSDNHDNELESYIILKYGDNLVNSRHLFKDRTPIPNVDYIVKRK